MTMVRKLAFLLVYTTIVAEAPTLSAEPETEKASVELEEIIVTATRNRRSFGQQPTLVEVLNEEELNEFEKDLDQSISSFQTSIQLFQHDLPDNKENCQSCVYFFRQLVRN